MNALKKYADPLYRGSKPTTVIATQVASTGAYAGASYAFGYLQSRYRDKASVMGIPLDLAAGVGMKALAIGAEMMGYGGLLSEYGSIVGNAGLGSYFHTLGAGHGGAKSGLTRVVANPADVKKIKAVAPSATVLGELGAAPHGDFLSREQLRDLAR